MWNFVNSLPEESLESWYRWLTFLTIGLPISAHSSAVFAGVFVVNGRIGDIQTVALHHLDKDLRE